MYHGKKIDFTSRRKFIRIVHESKMYPDVSINMLTYSYIQTTTKIFFRPYDFDLSTINM